MATPEVAREARLLQRYGLAPDEFDAMLREQGYRCPGCQTYILDDAQVDHCHDTGKVRGLLCRNCNTGLGQFRDNPATLARLIVYLLTPRPDPAPDDWLVAEEDIIAERERLAALYAEDGA